MKLTSFEKLMLLNAHPIKANLNLVGAAIALYFLWVGNGWYALYFGVGAILLGSVLAKLFGNFTPEKLVETFWGKIHLHYTGAFGFTLYLAGHISIPFGFWLHNYYVIVIGVILLSIGLLIPIRKFELSDELANNN